MRHKGRILLFILFVASVLRLWHVNSVPVSLFGDELDVGYHAYNILKTGRDYSGNFLPLHFQSLAESRTPLYLYSVVPTVALFGISPLGVRLPAVIFGILGIWGMYLLVRELGRYGKYGEKKSEILALVSATVLAFSPWHIQYSRAAFEVTQLLAFYLFGLYFFFKSLQDDGKWLWVSVIFLVSTPLIYSTAKLFTPLLLLFLLVLFWKDLKNIFRKHLIRAGVLGILLGLFVFYATFFSGGVQRFSYISVFSDPTRETEIGVRRELAARFRGETGFGLEPTLVDKLFYNKFTFWGQNILKNYFESFSSEFFFIKGDLNLRHSIEGIAQFYKVEAIALLVGLILFFGYYKSWRVKIFITFWILVGVIPSAITRDGGRHATRLILILSPLIFLISFGLVDLYYRVKKPFNFIIVLMYLLLFSINFIFYQKAFWTENPWYSERWWHSGYKEAVEAVMEFESDYEHVLITDKNEPPWIFFAGWSEFDPYVWQNTTPDRNWIEHDKYGRVTTVGKYIFASPPGELYDWGSEIDGNTLFMASEKEVSVDLIREPDRTPDDLILIKSIPYPSGLPAFYIFSGRFTK